MVIFILFCVLLDRLDICLVFLFGEGEGEEIPSQADIYYRHGTPASVLSLAESMKFCRDPLTKFIMWLMR